MPQYVIRRLGFFYTDEAFAPSEEYKGSVVSVFSTLEEAKEAKLKADIVSLRSGSEWVSTVTDFIFYAENYDDVVAKLESYYKSELNLKIKDKYYIQFPKSMTDSQAQHLLEIMGLTFHEILEYSDDVSITIGESDDPTEAEVSEFL